MLAIYETIVTVALKAVCALCMLFVVCSTYTYQTTVCSDYTYLHSSMDRTQVRIIRNVGIQRNQSTYKCINNNRS